uniref:Uncharacterized protein n=1 Tax=Gongylonema pulchrum TaxID=637853 RepID=A0A183DC64_9BILA
LLKILLLILLFVFPLDNADQFLSRERKDKKDQDATAKERDDISAKKTLEKNSQAAIAPPAIDASKKTPVVSNAPTLVEKSESNLVMDASEKQSQSTSLVNASIEEIWAWQLFLNALDRSNSNSSLDLPSGIECYKGASYNDFANSET